MSRRLGDNTDRGQKSTGPDSAALQERMFGSLLSNLIAGTISIGLANLSTLILGLGTMMIAARYLPAEDFGSFALLLVLVGFLTQVSGFGLELSVARFLGMEEDERRQRQLAGTAMVFRAATIAVVGPLALIAAPAMFALFGSLPLFGLIVFVPVLYFLESAMSLCRSVLQGHLVFHRIAIAAFIAGLANVALTTLFLIIMGLGVAGMIYARIISSTLALIFLLFSSPVGIGLNFRTALLKELLRFGAPLQVNDILSFIFSRIDTLIIAALLGPADVAHYEVARKIPDSAARLYESFRSAFYPVMSRLLSVGKPTDAARLLNTATRLISFVTVLGLLLVLLFGRELIVLLFSEQYLASVPAFVLLTAALAVRLVGNTLGTSLVAAGDSGKPAVINVAHTAVTVVGNLVLIPIFGIAGAALASLAGSTATNPLNVLFLRRRGVGARISGYLKPALVFGGCAAVVLAVNPASLLGRASLIPVYLVACGLLSVVTRDDLLMLLGQTRGRAINPLRNAGSGGVGT